MRAPVSASKRCLVSAISARRAGEADPDRLEIDLALLHVGMVEQRDVERRHAVEERRLDAPDRREQIGEVARIRHERDRAAADERQRLHADVARRRETAAAAAKITSSGR